MNVVNWPEFVIFAVVALILLWGIGYNSAKGAAYQVQAETRQAVPEGYIRRAASCAVFLLVLAAVVCGGSMMAFQAWYGAR